MNIGGTSLKLNIYILLVKNLVYSHITKKRTRQMSCGHVALGAVNVSVSSSGSSPSSLHLKEGEGTRGSVQSELEVIKQEYLKITSTEGRHLRIKKTRYFHILKGSPEY